MDLFPLKALAGAFFVCFIDFFASISAQSRKEVKKSIKQTKNTPANARSGNKP